jgi:uncharacterized protein (TIGR00251 family)
MMKVEIASHSAGAVIKIKAHPGARRQGLSGIHDGALKIDVNSAPEKGKANKEIRKILAGVFGLRQAELELLSGETSQLKKILLKGIAPEEAAAKIQAVLKTLGAG